MMKPYRLSDRGFGGYEFKSLNNQSCSIQESSRVEPSIWLGLNDIKPKLFLPDVDEEKKGWIDYPLSDCVHIFGRMELTQDMVKELLPYLQYFADNGVLPTEEQVRTFNIV